MKEDQRQRRQQEIERVAYDLLETEGYEGISVLKIAKRAQASNETLYRWYGNKLGLFRALVESNAEKVKSQLTSQQAGDNDPWDRLDLLGPVLLSLLTGDRAIALNRAAAGDPSGVLGEALSQAGREAVVPLVRSLFASLLRAEDINETQAEFFTDVYLRLLVGDWQIRRATGAMKETTATMIEDRNRQTLSLIRSMLTQAKPA